ncbi:MAG: TonB-dependent receptor domain-containing protein [Vitreimonas sp.]
MFAAHTSGRAGLLLLSTALHLALPAPAEAQDQAPADEEEIVVTGSRILRDPLRTESPVADVTGEDLARTGLTSTADILQRQPFSGGGLNSRVNSSGNFGNPPDGGGVGAGSAEIDLRYLNPRRVLVLVDGLRWVNGASASGVPGSTDLNSIPASLIERIEILQEGASSIYGTDAIAGVVNIITRDQFEGFQASAYGGMYFEDGDGETENYELTWGARSDAGTHIVFGVNHVDQEGVSSADRAISRFPQPYATTCEIPGPNNPGGCSGFITQGFYEINDPTTPEGFIGLVTNVGVVGVPNYIPGDPTGPGSDFHSFTDADRFNFQPFNFMLTPSTRTGLFGIVTQDLTDDIRLRLRGVYNNRVSENQAAPIPIGVGPDAGNGNLLDTISIDVTNPFNPFGFTLEPGTYNVVARRLIEAGPRNFEQTVNTYYFAGTIEGDTTIAGRELSWDVNAVFSRNRADQLMQGNINSRRLQQALGPLAECTDPCVPFNIFGGAGTVTQEMLDFVGFVQHDVSEQELTDYTANVTSDLFQLPAGPFAIALGAEYRELSGFFQPDAVVVAGESSDIPAQPTSGSYDVTEFYGEVDVPILADMSFAHELAISAATRFSDYSTFGEDETSQAGIRWRPMEDLLLRATWAQGLRAPSIGELFGSLSRFDQLMTDPCSDMLVTQPPAVQANCIALGVPADGSYVQLNPQISVVTGGNPNLDPETSEGVTVGAVYNPNWARDASWTNGLTFEVNWNEIEVQDPIQPLNAQVQLNRCVFTLDPVSCAGITRTASGVINSFSNQLTNIGSVETESVDLRVAYESPDSSIGTFNVTWVTNFLLEFTEFVPATGGFTPISLEGVERGSPSQGFPEVKSTLILDWTRDDLFASLTQRYIDELVEQANGNVLAATWYTDAQFGWRSNQWTLVAGMTNLFDEDPPGCVSCDLNNYDPTTYDIPGRFGYVRIVYQR